MRHRGEQYWAWADVQLHSRSHDEILPDHTEIDVQTRLSRLGGAQLFIGVYARGGALIAEELYDNRPGETMSRALLWGVQRAREIAQGAGSQPRETARTG